MSVVELQADVALAVHAELGEGPVWDDRDGSLLFVDIAGRAVHRYHPATGSSSSFATGVEIGAAGLRDDGGLVLALAAGFARCGAGGEDIEAVPGFATEVALVRFNDGEVDPWGRFVAGTMHWGASDPVGGLYRLSPDGSVEQLLSGVTISNGLAWTADRTALYYVDTPTLRVDRFDVDPDDGTMTGRRRAITIDADEHGSPDGIALDVEGCIWVACYEGARVCRFTPEGVLDKIVRLPVSCVTSVAFGGAHLDQLYVTTGRSDDESGVSAPEAHGGDLFVVDPSVAGMLPARFG